MRSSSFQWFGFGLLLLMIFAFGVTIGWSGNRRLSASSSSNKKSFRVATTKSSLETEKARQVALEQEVARADALVEKATAFVAKTDKKFGSKSFGERMKESVFGEASNKEVLEQETATKDIVATKDTTVLIEEETKEEEETQVNAVNGATTVLVFCYNRPDYLARTLASLEKRLRNDPAVGEFAKAGLNIIISQDNPLEMKQVSEVASRWVSTMKVAGFKAEFWPQAPRGKLDPYYALALHYKMALSRVFSDSLVSRVIILEDDMELALDFFSLMLNGAPVLDTDDSLLAISAWNDHGRPDFASDPQVLVRADFFPGLGWMMPRRIWMELAPKWPRAYWDDWIRENVNRKYRQVLRPEVPRSITFGRAGGASVGQFFDVFLSRMRLNEHYVDFRVVPENALGPSPLFVSKKVYEAAFLKRVRASQRVDSVVELTSALGSAYTEEKKDLRLEYSTDKDYAMLAASMGIITDTKAGIPRGALLGVVPLRMRGRNVFVAPRGL